MSAEQIYVVTAYRHGEVNNHQYIVHAGTVLDLAVAAAKEENEGRGLKYGIEVVAYPVEEPVAYFPSYAEPKNAVRPAESPDRNAAVTIGERVIEMHRARRNDLPIWLVELCEIQLALYQRMS